MTVGATEAVGTTQPGLYTPPSSTSSEDKEMFLNLMVAQLRYQDPLNPADSGEFLAQSAQFTSLEKMQDVADQTAALLATSVSFGASNMVGRSVTYIDADGEAISGVVDSVSFDASGPMLQIGGQSVSLGQVQSVGTPPAPGTPATGTPATDTDTATDETPTDDTPAP
ncbi:flagellar hook capping FlgD N-terminal domain-containing protein [Nocardioides caricicola]|uniref:Flagellar hook capping FlgD N-terminal domain-containing protein n=1 Tax=Nocardioides caricicola TaxID=634770 RepID=A0ABW0N2Q3_9ACTN